MALAGDIEANPGPRKPTQISMWDLFKGGTQQGLSSLLRRMQLVGPQSVEWPITSRLRIYEKFQRWSLDMSSMWLSINLVFLLPVV